MQIFHVLLIVFKINWSNNFHFKLTLLVNQPIQKGSALNPYGGVSFLYIQFFYVM